MRFTASIKKTLGSGTLAILLMAVIAGCSGQNNTPAASESAQPSASQAADAGNSTSEPAAGGTFVYGRPAAVTSFDLHNQITSNNAFAIDKVFESLVAFNSEGEIVDWLAASHTISEDGLTYTFVLRDGLKFSDGNAVTAKDAVFSLERHLKVGGPLAIAAKVESVTAQDDKTLVIKLQEPYTPFISELSNFSNGVIPANFGGVTEEEFFKKPIGTGPFAIEAWDPAGDVTFVKNTNYWQEGKPAIDKLVYKLIEDDSQAINQLKAGEVNAVEALALQNAEELKNGADTAVVTNGSWVTEQLFFNTLDEHFKDVHVRRALALALDREGLTKALTFGYAQAANSLLPTTIPYNANDTIKALGYDVEAAKAELAKSAFPDGFSTKLLIASGNSTRAQEAQIIQAAGQAIGIKIEIESIELASFRERFFAYDFSAMLNSGQADSPEANSILAFQTDPEGFSKSYWTHYTNDEVTKLLYEGQKTADGDARAGIYTKLLQTLADEVPYIPLYYPDILIGARSSVEGLTVLPNGSVRFEDVRIGQ
ncbi:peptide ABC transporter substrate-binding protein [Paenibacillus sp. FSL R7-0273]|uniref:ABC transporter substrate-binding protein n=1 Tax=Paenibacillus sp. FSL R7-0273 TaxID=1536772 RepID=UPI0004F75E5A|nr:ABC transporter substrate-binding protein [Paenibacillus sp. FSL R7-0273]AIQ45992.1 peptide ABC transporter substrate-binding protein [Paenibacillus sp. FSL R7-0273]OMF92879.1 peptide ABC transporter substrate-binding protein [Paenibacillus sp. FSL R7-0273]